jgi:hypothetical protein
MVMTAYQRRSPVSFQAQPLKTVTRDDWTVVLEYEDQGDGPWLIDLSHRSRFDIQDGNIDKIKPWGISIPRIPGQSVFEKGILINRMNRTQISTWHLGEHKQDIPEISGCTDVTESTLLLALMGKGIFLILEKLTAMDLLDPNKTPPFLSQGPLSRVPCQVVILKRPDEQSAVLWTCSRGYGHDMVHAVMQAGQEQGIRVAGENAIRGQIPV